MTTDPSNERTLIERLQQGDDDAFRVFVDRYQSSIVNGALKFVRNVQAAEDITQEVFLEVFESIHSFRGDARLATWTYRIMIAKSLNWLRWNRRKKRFAKMLPFVDITPEQEPSSQPLLELEEKERAAVLTKALERLPERQRTAVTLSKYMGMSHAEIAEVLGVTIGTVDVLVHRAKAALRDHLSEYYQERV